MKYLVKSKSNYFKVFSIDCIIILSLIVVNIDKNEAKVLSQNKLCADIECKVPIATGKTTLSYQRKDEKFISFQSGVKATIFGRTEDSKVLDVEINGNRGLVPMTHILEDRIFERKLNFVVNIDVKPEKGDSETKVQNESLRTGDEGLDLKDSNKSGAEEAQSSKRPEVVSSLSEDITEAITKTPEREQTTVIEGTTFDIDGNIFEASPTVASELATATKTATISLNLENVTEVKPTVVLNESSVESVQPLTDNQSNISSEPNHSSEFSDSTASEVTDNETEVSLEMVEENKVLDEMMNKKSNLDNNISDNQKDNKNDLENSNNLKVETIDSNINNSAQSEVKSLAEKEDLNTSVDNEMTANFDSSSQELTNDLTTEATKPVLYSSVFESISETLFPDKADLEDISETQSTVKSEVLSSVSEDVSETQSLGRPEVLSSVSQAIPETQSTETPNVYASVSENTLEIQSTETHEALRSGFDDKPQTETHSFRKRETFSVSEDLSETLSSESDEVVVPSVSQEILETQSTQVIEDIPPETQSSGSHSLYSSISEDISQTQSSGSLEAITTVSEDIPETQFSEKHEILVSEGISETESSEILNAIPFTSEELTEPETEMPTKEETTVGGNRLGLEEMAISGVISDLIPDDIEMILKQFEISAQVVVFTFIIAFNWCLMKILLSIFNSSKKETELRNICCKAQRQVYYFEAEKQKLQKDIERETEKSQLSEERMQTAEHKVIPLEKEFLKLKSERDQLYQKVMGLENELESAAEAGLEANRLLNDFLTSQKENVNLNSSVDALQQQITKQADIVAKYQSTAAQKEKENLEFREKIEKTSAELKRLKNVLKETEHNLETFQKNNDELKASKSELNFSLSQLESEYSSLQTKADDYIERNDELLKDVQRLSEEVKEIRGESANKDVEIGSLKEILSKLGKVSNDCGVDNEERESDQIDSESREKCLTDLYDIIQMDLQLKNITNEKNELNSKLEQITEECKQLNHRLGALEEDNKSLKTERESAVQDKVKAQMELEVLSKYYKEKEMELGKEIGVQHIQRLQKEEDADSLVARLGGLEEENVSLRSQLQSMKKEIANTERKYKTQINQLEKQVHENWILARNAERKLEESKAEAAVLRQTLTMSVKSPVDGYGDMSYLDDSASSVSSLHDQFGAGMIPPPPPPLPPPPPPPMFNPLMSGMHLPFNEETDPMGLWNQNMNSMSVGSHMPQMPNNFGPIATDMSMTNNHNPNLSYANPQPLSYVPSLQHQWDSSSNRDTYSPASHRSTSSPHSQYNMYSQPMSHYSNQMTSMSSPVPPNSMSANFSNSMTSVTSPLVNSSPSVQPSNVLSNPVPSHWVQPNQPNGNVSNSDYSHNDYNGSEASSRSASRNDNSLHTSIV